MAHGGGFSANEDGSEEADMMKTTFEPFRLDDQGTSANVSRRPRRRRWLIAALMAAAMATSAVAVFVWQRSEVRDAETVLEQALVDRDAALGDVARLRLQVQRLRDGLGADISALEQRLARVRAELLAIAGPALPDGRHFTRFTAVGDEQQPPRLIVDLQQWFTDQAAVEAALEDGVHPSEAGINGYYIRNENPRWRIVMVDPLTKVALTTYPHGQIDNPGIVTFERFGELFRSPTEYLDLSPYWITVKDGTVVRIEQQFVP